MVEIINFNGEDNIVIQSTNINGNLIEQQKSFQDFVSPFSVSYQMQIEDLQNTIEDKKRTNGLINKEVIELYIKKETLENKKANKEQQVAHLLKELNGKVINDTSSLFQHAFNYFIEGDVDAALSVLEDTKIQEEEKKDNKNSKQYAEIRILKARLLIIKNKFEEASRNYERAFELYSVWNTAFEVGNYYYYLKKYERAERYFKISLKKAQNDSEKGRSLNNIGALKKENNDYYEAKKYYKRTLKIYQNLNKLDPSSHLQMLSTVFHNLGQLFDNQNEFLESEKYYKLSLEIRRKLAKNKDERYLLDLSATINSLGCYFYKRGDNNTARKYFVEALTIRENLMESNKQLFLSEVAQIKSNLADLERSDGNFIKAAEIIKEAEKIYRKLTEVNPYTHLPNWANSLRSSGIIFRKNHKFGKAEKFTQDALKIYSNLAEVNPNIYLSLVAESNYGLGIINETQLKFEIAEKHYQEALKIYENFAKLVPEKYDINLAHMYMCLGNLYGFDKLNEEKLFQKNISKSIELYEKYKSPEAKKWGEVAKDILAEWKKKWLENFDKVIDETFDEYDEVFKALA